MNRSAPGTRAPSRGNDGLSLAGFISGGAGLLTLAVYQSALLALVQITTFTIWALTAAIVLFRSESALGRLP